MVLDFDRVAAKGLVKVYGPTRALAGVDVAFEASTVTAIEGPNGSGKSTLLQLLALMARPTRGEIMFGSHSARGSGARALRASIGVLAHAPMLYPDLTAHENLELMAKLYAVPNSTERLRTLVERFGLGSWAMRPARTYSRGQLQRASLARAILHAPRLLLLDEPSTGLDSASVERLATAVEFERERGAIVVMVTHDAPLSERLATRRVSLRQGKVDEASA